MNKLHSITGRKYNLADYFGCKNPSKIVVIMASGGETAIETADYLNRNGENVGVIKIRLYHQGSVSYVIINANRKMIFAIFFHIVKNGFYH